MSFIQTPPPQLLGENGGAETLANQLAAYGANAQNRVAAQIAAPAGANPQALANQQQANALLAQQASGAAPNASAIGMSAGMDQGAGAAFAAGRGGTGFGATNAGRGIAGVNQGLIGQGGAGTMQQVQAGQQGLTSGLNTLGAQSIQQQQQDQQVALAQAQLTQQQQAANNQAQLGYQGMATGALQAQLQSDTSQQMAATGDASQVAVQGIQQQAALNNALIGASASGAAGLGTMAAQFNNSSGTNVNTSAGGANAGVTTGGTIGGNGTTDTGLTPTEEDNS